MSKVSICVPVYNNPEGLRKLLESIVIQKYKNFEVIVSDDSDNDKCKDIAYSFKESINLKYIKHRATGRPGDNWNSSIENVSGEYIKMMFHDDWFTDSSSLEKFVDLLDNSKAVFAFSGSVQVSSDWRYARHIKDEDLKLIREDIRNLYIGNVIGAPSATIYRNRGIKFDRNLSWLIDMDFYLRQMDANTYVDGVNLAGNNLFGNTDEPLVSIGISSSQLTNYCKKHPGVVRREYFYVGRKHRLLKDSVYKKYFISQLKNPH